MKYFGEKSVSSWILIILRVVHVLAYVILVGGSLFWIFLSTLLYFEGDLVAAGHIAEAEMPSLEIGKDEEGKFFLGIPYWVKLLMLPYFWALFYFIIKTIRRSKNLFTNFRDNVVFKKENVELISRIGKLMIIISVMTFDFKTLFLSVFVFMLAEIFKNATRLQEEADFTV